MSKHLPPKYQAINWQAYNQSLKQRGQLLLWLDKDMNWLALRQATGMVESMLRLAGLEWVVPDFSTFSRRQKDLQVRIPVQRKQGCLHLLVDSTGTLSEVPGENALEKVEWLPSPQPSGDENALLQIAGRPG